MNANMALYHAKYIKPGSFQPVLHVMLGMWAIGYSIEHSHLKHKEDAANAIKYGGGSGH